MSDKGLPIVPVQWKPRKGGMKSDIDPKEIQNGDMYVSGRNTGAYNVRMIGKGLNVSPSKEPVIGSILSYTIDPATAQNKVFQLNFDISAFTDPSFTLSFSVTSPSGTALVTSSTIVPTGLIGAILTSVEAIFAGAPFSALTPTTSQTTLTSTSGYVTVEFTTPAYYDFGFLNYNATALVNSTVSIIQEAIDPGMTGEWNLIGSNKNTGDSFQFWTTRNGYENTIDIQTVANNGSGLFRITTTTAHGYSTGQIVKVLGDFGMPLAIGIWAVTVISPTQFDLQLSSFGGAYTSGGTVTSNIYGLGEIGVAVKDYNSNTISYTRLLRSRELNFSTLYQVSAEFKKKQDNKIAGYFTDQNNLPRVFYYKGAYITDGALASVSANGQYEYGTISEELTWFASAAGFNLEWTNQIQSGGALRSGNWFYSARFLTPSLSGTEWTLPTNPVPVYNTNNQTDGAFVIGDEENTVTGKINVLTITNPVPGLFKYVEIAAVNYVGNATQGYVIGRYLLTQEDSQQISHTGNESGVTTFDPSIINTTPPAFIKARNVALLDNRAILSNLIPDATIDFSSWVQTWEYIIDREALDSCGIYSTTLTDATYGEYQKPENVNQKMTHMLYETYRYGFMFRLKATGRLTNVFYFGEDIKIDLPTVFPTRRQASLTFNDFNITNSTTDEVYTFLINFTNIDMTYVIDGVPVGELITEIVPVRAKVVPTVLASGLAVLGVTDTLSDAAARMFYAQDTTSGPGAPQIGPFPYISGSRLFDIGYTNIASASSATLFYPNLFTADRDSVFLYAPDHLYENIAIEFQSGDKLISLGCPDRANLYYDNRGGPYPTANGWPFVYAEFNGRTDIADNTQIVEVDCAEVFNPSKGEAPIVTSVGADFSLLHVWDHNYASQNVNNRRACEKCLAVRASANITYTGSGNDYGAYRVFYYRPLVDQYGDIGNTQYETTGVALNTEQYVGSIIGSGILKVYGDCFTQKNYLKWMYPADNGYNMASAIGFYSQNRINSQMKHKPSPTATDIPPVIPIFNWMVDYTTGNPWKADGNLRYNEGYNPDNRVVDFVAFDSNLEYQLDWANAIAWSDIESDGSSSDTLRIFPPLNLKFLDYSDGPITETLEFNGELVAFQPKNITRQYFNTTSALTTGDGSQVILGDGGVMQRRGTTITKFGCNHKWSIVKAKSDKGFDVIFFFDEINNVLCRIGYNGPDDIAEIDGMKSFFNTYSRFIKGKDNPTYTGGISSVSNQRYREVYFTFRGIKSGVAAWDAATGYNQGDVVSFTPSVYSEFEQTGEFAVALQANINVNPDSDTAIWQVISHDDPDYYSEFTLSYNTLKNEFEPFMAFKPKLYASIGDGYLMPRPISNTGQMYSGNDGTQWCRWFHDGITAQTANSYFDAVINSPEGRKSFVALRIESNNRPDRIEVFTNQHTTYMSGSDCEQREGNEFDVPVMNDSTVTGLNNGNTSTLFGDYAIARFIQFSGNYNLWSSFVMKVRVRARQFFR